MHVAIIDDRQVLEQIETEREGIKASIRDMLERRHGGLNRFSWWGGRDIRIRIEDRYGLVSSFDND